MSEEREIEKEKKNSEKKGGGKKRTRLFNIFQEYIRKEEEYQEVIY